MEKEPYTNFCDVLISFHEVMKLKSFEFDESDVINANVKTSPHWFSLHFSCLFHGEKIFNKVLQFPWPFYELIKFQNFELIKLFLNVSDIIHANKYA